MRMALLIVTDASQPAAIEAFINRRSFRKYSTRDIEKNKIGSGSCGTVYLLNDEFVVTFH